MGKKMKNIITLLLILIVMQLFPMEVMSAERSAWKRTQAAFSKATSPDEIKALCEKIAITPSTLEEIEKNFPAWQKNPHGKKKFVFKGGNLQGFDSSCGYCIGLDFSCTNLSGANFEKGSLNMTSFKGANLSGVNFKKAVLAAVDFTGANLSNADLTGAYLNDATLTNANFSNATLAGVNFKGAKLSGANFHGVKGINKASLNKLKNRAINASRLADIGGNKIDITIRGDELLVGYSSAYKLPTKRPSMLRIMAKIPASYKIVPSSIVLMKGNFGAGNGEAVAVDSLDTLKKNGTVISKLYDDGTHGDSIIGDNIFSTQVIFNEEKPSKIQLGIWAKSKGNSELYYSEILPIDFIDKGSQKKKEIPRITSAKDLPKEMSVDGRDFTEIDHPLIGKMISFKQPMVYLENVKSGAWSEYTCMINRDLEAISNTYILGKHYYKNGYKEISYVKKGTKFKAIKAVKVQSVMSSSYTIMVLEDENNLLYTASPRDITGEGDYRYFSRSHKPLMDAVMKKGRIHVSIIFHRSGSRDPQPQLLLKHLAHYKGAKIIASDFHNPAQIRLTADASAIAFLIASNPGYGIKDIRVLNQ